MRCRQGNQFLWCMQPVVQDRQHELYKRRGQLVVPLPEGHSRFQGQPVPLPGWRGKQPAQKKCVVCHYCLVLLQVLKGLVATRSGG